MSRHSQLPLFYIYQSWIQTTTKLSIHLIIFYKESISDEQAYTSPSANISTAIVTWISTTRSTIADRGTVTSVGYGSTGIDFPTKIHIEVIKKPCMVVVQQTNHDQCDYGPFKVVHLK